MPEFDDDDVENVARVMHQKSRQWRRRHGWTVLPRWRKLSPSARNHLLAVARAVLRHIEDKADAGA